GVGNLVAASWILCRVWSCRAIRHATHGMGRGRQVGPCSIDHMRRARLKRNKAFVSLHLERHTVDQRDAAALQAQDEIEGTPLVTQAADRRLGANLWQQRGLEHDAVAAPALAAQAVQEDLQETSRTSLEYIRRRACVVTGLVTT